MQIGFGALLTIVFIVLKFTNVIDWSWWWVLSPIWIVYGLVVLGVFVIMPVLERYNRKTMRNELDKLLEQRRNVRPNNMRRTGLLGRFDDAMKKQEGMKENDK